MNKSENINELAASLSRAQGAIKGALKDSLNPHFKAKYADLASTWDACREQLAKNDLSVVQMPDVSEGGYSGRDNTHALIRPVDQQPVCNAPGKA